MALSDLAIFNEQVRDNTIEMLDQQIDVFNGASRGTIVLTPSANKGSFTETALFANIGNIIRNRNPFEDKAIDSTSLKNVLDVSVKIGSGTPEIRLDQSEFDWIQQKPAHAAAAVAKSLAAQMMQDYLNKAIGVSVAAIGQSGDVTTDVTAATTDNTVTLGNLLHAAGKFGDRQQAIRAWVLHSSAMTNLWSEALKNGQSLFKFESVNIWDDGFGRIFIVTDSPNLTWQNDGKSFYNTIGLTPEAVVVESNNDFHSVTADTTGYTNLRRTFQAEWSANYGVKGYKWNKSVEAPTDAALLTAANWPRWATSHKDTAGVILKSA